jgi:hypothetical protein
MSSRNHQRALRWYPSTWRRRYGSELAALLEDTYGDQRLPVRARLSLLRAGLTERLRAGGLAGSSRPASAGVRAGALLALWAWATCMVAGGAFANIADGWQPALPAGSTFLPMAGYVLAAVAGLAGGCLVLAGAALCMPAFIRFLRAGGWAQIRGRVLLAASLLALTIMGFAAARAWAAHLDQHQRNGGLWTYSLLFIVVALLASATIAAWTAAGAAAARRIELPVRVLRTCQALAIAIAVVIAVLIAGTATWWAAIAARAPWFFTGAPHGAAGSVAPAGLIGVVVLMTAGLLLGAAGAWRASAAARRLADEMPAGSQG